MSRAVMQQALEALENDAMQRTYAGGVRITNAAIALRAALAEPEQEPVAWGVFDGPNLHDVNFTEEEAQEMVRLKGDGSVVKPLYTAPTPRRPLTDEEIGKIAGDCLDAWSCARAIERAHGIGEQREP